MNKNNRLDEFGSTPKANEQLQKEDDSHMAGGEIFELEMDCQRKYGDDLYTFYSEFHVGNMLVYAWSRDCSSRAPVLAIDASRTGAVNSKMYAAQIYENGDLVDFTKDPRFRSAQWIKPGVKLADHCWSRQQLLLILQDLHGLAACGANGSSMLTGNNRFAREIVRTSSSNSDILLETGI